MFCFCAPKPERAQQGFDSGAMRFCAAAGGSPELGLPTDPVFVISPVPRNLSRASPKGSEKHTPPLKNKRET
jgi:hypothetical protein